jgi:hypothetical protein
MRIEVEGVEAVALTAVAMTSGAVALENLFSDLQFVERSTRRSHSMRISLCAMTSEREEQ